MNCLCARHGLRRGRDPVALQSRTWQGAGMTIEKPKSPPAGGIFLALGAIGGVMIGRVYDQPSIGLVAGVTVGAAIAALIWWRGR